MAKDHKNKLCTSSKTVAPTEKKKHQFEAVYFSDIWTFMERWRIKLRIHN